MKLKVVQPCGEGWDRMEPRPGGRYCRSCARTVIDFTRLTEAQAAARIRRARGRICGHALVHRETGHVVFRPSAPWRAPRWAGGAVLAAALGGGCASAAPTPTGEPGAVAPIEAPPVSAGPPMEPVDPDEPRPEPRIATRAVPAEELGHDGGDGTPTAAQRARTARKHPPPTAATVIAFPYQVIDGMMDSVDGLY